MRVAYFNFLQRLSPSIVLEIAAIAAVWFQFSLLGFISFFVSFSSKWLRDFNRVRAITLNFTKLRNC